MAQRAGRGKLPLATFVSQSGPAALVLNVRIRFPLDNLLNGKSCPAEVGCYLVRTKKEKVHADLLPPPLIQMNAVVADVESEQQDPAWSQHSPELAQRSGHV